MEQKKVLFLLELLGFEEVSKKVYKKVYTQHHNYKIIVDLKRNKVFYRDDDKTVEGGKVKPDGKILVGEKTSSDLSKPESFVVLEAVDRLLEKGYSPAHLHLEKKWTLGRTAKGGRADIIVYDRETDDEGYLKPLIIIECKTWDKEFEKEKQRLKKNGGQLFSYLQQERGAKYLVLYTSDIFESKDSYFIDYDNVIIKVIDDENKVKQCREENKKKKSKKPCSFQEATNKEELFELWKRLYRSYWYKYGIFEPEIPPYNIELKPLKKKDLIELSNPQGLFNKFAEILRHNNISDNANAFNKMLNLILCKIVDEEEKSEGDELDFQVKGDEEYEKLVDRLQRLYYVGMKEHLGISDFVYYPDEEIIKRIKLYPERKNLEEVFNIFKEIKYYTNNEFAFKEVHNKKLFDENAEILIEVIELIQNYKFKYAHNHQILGDFFELLLDFGVKQSEGQFFTPMPIVSFINGSLNIKRIIEEKLKWEIYQNKPFPKFLDFACGAGHFITDMMDRIREITPKFKEMQEEIQKDNVWERKYIYGIEKDYRLARTSKIACFLAGDGEANIIYGDGLKDYKKLNLEEEKFDVISTNPPYSVRNFKKYLDVPEDKYELLPFLTENSKEIEVLFIERAKQLLKEDIGRVGIILPSSILSNSGIYEKAREILLKYFEIKAIVELGSNAFIATGTNAVILFLKRRKDGFFIDRKRLAEEIFTGRYFVDPVFKMDYLDGHKFLDLFITYRNLPKNEYIEFVRWNKPSEKLFNLEIFKDYKKEFEKSKLLKDLKKKKEFKNLSEDDKKRKIEDLFIEFVKEKEKEKFFYFLLMFLDGYKAYDKRFYTFNKVLIVKAFDDNEKQKQFLGYEFSKRRGYEGIKIFKDKSGKPTSKLYDPENLDNPKKVSFYVRASFDDKYLEDSSCLNIAKELKENVKWCDLVDLIDFEKVDIDKAISLDCKRQEFISSKWETVRLGEVAKIESGGTPRRDVKEYWNGDINWIKSEVCKDDYVYQDDVKEKITELGRKKANLKIFEPNTVLVSLIGKSKVGYLTFKSTVNQNIAGIYNLKNLLPKYLFYLFKFTNILKNETVNSYKMLPISKLKSLKIPLPPLEVQKQIVEEIEKLEEKEKENLEKIKQLEKQIKEEVEKIFKENFKMVRLEEILENIKGSKTKVKKGEIKNVGSIPVITQEKDKFISGYVDNVDPITDLPLIVFGDHTFVFKYVDFPFVRGADGTQLIKVKNNINLKYVFYVLQFLDIPDKNKYKRHFKILKSLKIPLPPLEVQKNLVEKLGKIEEKIKEIKEENKKIQDKIKEILEENF